MATFLIWLCIGWAIGIVAKLTHLGRGTTFKPQPPGILAVSVVIQMIYLCVAICLVIRGI